MFRGTTPTLIIRLNTEVDLETCKQIWITFDNAGKVLTKTKEDIEIEAGGRMKISLTQEETLSFTGSSIDVQVRLLTDSDSALATPIKKLPVSRVLEGGVIE